MRKRTLHSFTAFLTLLGLGGMPSPCGGGSNRLEAVPAVAFFLILPMDAAPGCRA